MTIKRLALAFALLLGIAATSSSYAGYYRNCTTNCYGNQCTTTCY